MGETAWPMLPRDCSMTATPSNAGHLCSAKSSSLRNTKHPNLFANCSQTWAQVSESCFCGPHRLEFWSAVWLATSRTVEEPRGGCSREAVILLVRLDVGEPYQVPKFRRNVRLPRLPQFGIESVGLEVLRNEARQKHDYQHDGSDDGCVLHAVPSLGSVRPNQRRAGTVPGTFTCVKRNGGGGRSPLRLTTVICGELRE
jgi:hypothetical protein